MMETILRTLHATDTGTGEEHKGQYSYLLDAHYVSHEDCRRFLSNARHPRALQTCHKEDIWLRTTKPTAATTGMQMNFRKNRISWMMVRMSCIVIQRRSMNTA
ncbi:uncharacterized protein LOC121859233 [Homarus americanus]|uniref:uncharacterized protein LOC121859233 n=1 Tax=Homarus americanus TaxID=6706 RepID=UPI001C45509F|nr:uncharacterized protein LOC121859233 [Homarus americanus]